MRALTLTLLVFCTLSSVAAEPAGAPAAGSTPAAAPALATFAGGCFWCMEPPYEKEVGVLTVVSGYTGGTQKNPSYEAVSSGHTGHAEAVQVTYDPAKISYARLLDIFWRNIDPLAVDRQFCDAGNQYRSAIFYHDAQQEAAARASKEALSQSGRFKEPIATLVVAAGDFYPAEDYHQGYSKKNVLQYKYYRYRCGRDQRLTELWGASPK